MSARSTKKAKAGPPDEMRAEYSRKALGAGTRGKYHADYVAGSNVMLIEPDVASVFATPKAVNEALRSLIAVARRVAPPEVKRAAARRRRPRPARRA